MIMTELMILYFFLGIGFVLAPLMTNRFFLNNSKVYSTAHKVVLSLLLVGACLPVNHFAFMWPLFCVLGFILYLVRKDRPVFFVRNWVHTIPFLFSLISATWFYAGVHDLQLLGYDRVWSFYAALHGIFLGWLFVGSLAFLSAGRELRRPYHFCCYLSFTFFLFVALGIDGIPHVKRLGVIGLSIMVPMVVGAHAFMSHKGQRSSRWLSTLSFCSVIASMSLALLNEFWFSAPKLVHGIPLMVLGHGLLNSVISIPCFFLAVRAEQAELSHCSP